MYESHLRGTPSQHTSVARHRRFTVGVVILLAAFAAAATIIVLEHGRHEMSTSERALPYNRLATWDQPAGDRPLTRSQMIALADHGGTTVLNPARPHFNIERHFAAARDMAAIAGQHHRKLHIFEYFNVRYWYASNVIGLSPYSHDFRQSWLLRDYADLPIAYDPYSRSLHRRVNTAQLLNLADPALRHWITRTICAWMRAAPYAGVVLDSAIPLRGAATETTLGSGGLSADRLLCGTDAQSCSRVSAWNAGLSMLVAEVSSALRRLGDVAYYNGVEPNTANNNLGLLHRAGGVIDEHFCIERHDSGIAYVPAEFELRVMTSLARANEQLLDISNYDGTFSPRLANYCTALFLMGWRPGESIQVFHRDYSDLRLGLPSTLEQRSSLGTPRGNYLRSGSVLRRWFHNGLVLVNISYQSLTVRLPGAASLCREAASARRCSSSATVVLGPHSAQYFRVRQLPVWEVRSAPTATATWRLDGQRRAARRTRWGG